MKALIHVGHNGCVPMPSEERFLISPMLARGADRALVLLLAAVVSAAVAGDDLPVEIEAPTGAALHPTIKVADVLAKQPPPIAGRESAAPA